MAEAVVSVVLETVARLLVDEGKFLYGVSAEVEDLCTELRQMQCFLRDADAKQHENESVRNLLREIRNLSYRIEDLVEIYAIQAEAKKSSPRRGIQKFVRNPLRICGKIGTLHKLGNEIENIKRSIINITANFQKYGIAINHNEGESSNQQQYQQWVRQTYDHQNEDYFVGMEDDIENLVSIVTSDDNHNNIIIIWGMGGLGKTTIARKVCNHKDVKASFDRFAWTCITQKPNIDEILGDLLTQLVPEKEKGIVNSMTGRELVRELHQAQMETNCLIVLDDIWEVEHWKSIQAAFHSQGGNTKLLLTTRNKKVAEIGICNEIEFLTESEGWELLQQIASSGNTDFKTDPCFKEVGIKLASKCGGLPLAIWLLGGILKDKTSLEGWEIVNRNISLYLNKIEEDGETSGSGSLDQVLSLSYIELPHHLKLCFLYFANIKEDEGIPTEELYPLWITEGLVLSKHQRSGENLKEVAERYLSELGHRCMVELVLNEISITPRFIVVHLHDVMRDFCLEKCREQEFIRVVRDSYNHIKDNNNGAHRLVIHFENEENTASIVTSADQQDGNKTRSLFCLNSKSGKQMTWPEDLVLQNFKKLRVLNFEGLTFGRTLPLDLRNLIHLRILRVVNCELDELPSSLADLPLLHTLDLNINRKLKIPNVLLKMKRLRVLKLGLNEHYTDDGGKLRIYSLRELDTIYGMDSSVDEIADLLELTNIHYLECTVQDIDNFYVLMDYIHGNGQNLQEMSIYIYNCDFTSERAGYDLLRRSFKGERLRNLSINGKLAKFPCYEPQFLQCLTLLVMRGNHMEEDPMKTLQLLPHLLRLRLKDDSYMGQQLTCHAPGFPQLTFLSLRGLPNLEFWMVDEGSMPKLRHLHIQNCPSLAMIPDGLRFVEGLKSLTVEDMSSEFCDRLKVAVDGKKGHDYYKIQHVPSVDATPI